MWLASAASQGGPWINGRGDDSRCGRRDVLMPNSTDVIFWMRYLVTHSGCLRVRIKHSDCLSIGDQRPKIRVQLVAAVGSFVPAQSGSSAHVLWRS